MRLHHLHRVFLGVILLGVTTTCEQQKPKEPLPSSPSLSPIVEPAASPQVSATPEKEIDGKTVKIDGRLSFQPNQGYVPDEETAIKIAEAVWLPIYGEDTLKRERPFRAYLEKDVWLVHGTMKEHSVGGVAEARISKKTGCILQVMHSM